MNIYENNKQLLTAMGGDSYNLATDYEVRKAILELLGGDTSTCNSIYEVDLQILNIYLEGGGGTGGDCDLIPITITENGVYSRENGGYSEVTVNVAGGGGDVGEKLKLKKIGFDDGSVVNGTIDIDNVYNKIDINYLSDMSEMFEKCYLLTHLDLSGFVTSNVKYMYQMFKGCSSLQSLDVSDWNTSNVTDMNNMFFDCSSLQSLDVSGWDTSNVTDMLYMFFDCSSLQTLDVSGWDTRKVTITNNMFNSCSSLQSLDVSGWDTSNVTNMGNMFYNCLSLQTLDVSNWDTSNVTDMGYMFYNCSSLQTLDVSNWDTNGVFEIYSMFYNCSSLTQLDLTNWNIGSAEGISGFSAGSGIINYVGGRTIDEVIANNITILDGFRVSSSDVMSTVADRASLRALINGLLPASEEDLEWGVSGGLGLYQSNLDTLTEEDIAVATEKNWSIWAI